MPGSTQRLMVVAPTWVPWGPHGPLEPFEGARTEEQPGPSSSPAELSKTPAELSKRTTSRALSRTITGRAPSDAAAAAVRKEEEPRGGSSEDCTTSHDGSKIHWMMMAPPQQIGGTTGTISAEENSGDAAALLQGPRMVGSSNMGELFATMLKSAETSTDGQQRQCSYRLDRNTGDAVRMCGSV